MSLKSWWNEPKQAKKTAEKTAATEQELMQYQISLSQNRESQRENAIGAMNNLLGSAQAYKTPESVSKYANLMTSLGGELSQLRDPSNKSNIDLSRYTSNVTEYTPTPWSQITGETPSTDSAPITAEQLTQLGGQAGKNWRNKTGVVSIK